MHIRTVEIKIFAPGNKSFVRRRVVAGSGKAFTGDGVESLVDLAAAVVERMYPDHEYTTVDVGKGKINFVWRGEKKKGPETLGQIADTLLREDEPALSAGYELDRQQIACGEASP